MALEGIGTILGGLPVYVIINCGKDPDTQDGYGEYWAEVESIHWLKKNGKPGKEVPEHMFERGKIYDYEYCDLIQNISEQDYYMHYRKVRIMKIIENRRGIKCPIENIPDQFF